MDAALDGNAFGYSRFRQHRPSRVIAKGCNDFSEVAGIGQTTAARDSAATESGNHLRGDHHLWAGAATATVVFSSLLGLVVGQQAGLRFVAEIGL